jgi:hypothetical protein
MHSMQWCSCLQPGLESELSLVSSETGESNFESVQTFATTKHGKDFDAASINVVERTSWWRTDARRRQLGRSIDEAIARPLNDTDLVRIE